MNNKCNHDGRPKECKEKVDQSPYMSGIRNYEQNHMLLSDIKTLRSAAQWSLAQINYLSSRQQFNDMKENSQCNFRCWDDQRQAQGLYGIMMNLALTHGNSLRNTLNIRSGPQTCDWCCCLSSFSSQQCMFIYLAHSWEQLLWFLQPFFFALCLHCYRMLCHSPLQRVSASLPNS